VADDVHDVIVERAGGDLRSAINDLESLAVGKRTLVAEATRALGYRDRARTIFPVLEEILRSGDARRARDAVRELDESPEDLILWVTRTSVMSTPDRTTWSADTKRSAARTSTSGERDGGSDMASGRTRAR